MSIAEASKRIPEKVFRDPVHDYIHVQQQIILDLINTKEMQRLRRIKQMGTSSFTFHGAEHSRFSHSLGVYEIARKICDKFVRNYAIENGGVWDDSERLVVLCAALLHDIGHGPFSHTFESIFDTNHEEVTQEIILSEDTEVNQVLRTVSPDFPRQVASVIDKTYPNPQVVQLISSQIDADRMDYLLRDSYFSGTNYGNFDLSRILRVMHPYKDGIRFDYNGMHAVEDYITSRYQMYMQVYFHPVSRGMEMLLNHLLKRAQELFLDKDKFKGHETYAPFLEPFFDQTWTLSDYLRLDDGILQTYFQHWITYADDPILRDLSVRFIDRKPFKSVSYNEENDQEEIKDLVDLVGKLGYDIRYYVAINSRFDLPYDFYRPESEKPRTQIELVEKNGHMVELSQASSLIAAFTGQQRGDERIYLPNELFYGKNRDNITLFEPLLNQIHAMTKTGKITSIEEANDIDF